MAGGFNSRVTFSYAPPVTCVTVTFSPGSRTSTGNAVMTVNATNSANPGTYTITVRGVNDSGSFGVGCEVGGIMDDIACTIIANREIPALFG